MADAHPPHPPGHPPHPPVPPRRTPAAMLSNVLAIAGFVILIAIVIWGLIHIASLSSGWFGSFIPKRAPAAITLSLPESAHTGEPVRVGWTYATETAGHFAFYYECAEGVEFGIPIVRQGETRAQLAPVACGETFTLGNATSSVIVVPILATSTAQTAHLSMIFLPTTGGAQAQGNGELTILPAETTPEPAPKQPTATQSPPRTSGTAASSGPADLVVSILSATTDASGLSTVTFDIRNDGGSASGGYTFSAYLPTSQPHTFFSEPQVALAPGAHIVNTLRFSQSISGAFTVVIDPSNVVREANESNNSAGTQISAPYPTYTTYNLYPSPTYPGGYYGY